MKRLLALVFVVFAAHAYGEGGTFTLETLPRTESYGALAFDVKSRSWAYAVNAGEKGRASSIVAKLCGQSCEVYGPFEQCAAIVTNGTDVGYDFGTGKLAAEASALNKCGGNCEIVASKCTQQGAGEEFGYRRETHYPRNFGAISFDASSGAFGTAWDQPGFAEAVAVAKGNCGKECRLRIAQAGDCGVLANGDKGTAIGSGIDYKAAESMALTKCGNGSCKVVSWFCNSKAK